MAAHVAARKKINLNNNKVRVTAVALMPKYLILQTWKNFLRNEMLMVGISMIILSSL